MMVDLNNLSDAEYDRIEQRMRRAALRQDLVLTRHRGTYGLFHRRTGSNVAGDHNGYGMSLNEVERALSEA